ncbi:dienelactone hydrolase family protein [Halorubellus sp. PRR65]|uniref:alpha/beta fold hydrolase n=1 Tax=Halorubellus sp. PRR65 TaxID=3098148 RepID=UPI002B25AAB7|nr:dienelactone hydrolase family protein [Halorubellus sp. PRR65]
MPLEQLDFEVGGETYEGRFVTPPAGDAEACVVVVPGAGHGPFGDIFDITMYELANAGVASFRYESWTSSDELDAKTLAALQAELQAAVDQTADRGYEHVSLLVKSFGGRIAFTDLPERVERVLGWAPAVVFADDSGLDEQRDVPLDDLDDGLDIAPTDVAGVDVPVTLLYGDEDHFYPEHAEALADALSDAELRVLPGENHSFNARRRVVVAETVAALAGEH